jgi:UDP-N-acetylglucosamine/UDP-N-acetylgalactosamine diphosphorylase
MIDRKKPSMQERIKAARRLLDDVGQAHVLHFFDQLDTVGQAKLLGQIESVDWAQVQRLIAEHVKNRSAQSPPTDLEPAPWYPHVPPAELEDTYGKAHALGCQLLAQGQVAAFTVAGGQGTRLGWSGPKGTYPATALHKTPLFGCVAHCIRKAASKYGAAIRWYIMTSAQNHEQTCAYFDEYDYFGLDSNAVMFFRQAELPAVDLETGAALLTTADSLALAPDGHGGSLRALHTSGALDDMKRHGITQISYTQVDNPIVKVIDPQFLGLHALDDCQMSSKMLPKAFADEKVGNFCLVDGKLSVIEYSNLPKAYTQQRNDDGELRFKAGSIAIHMIRVDFIEALNQEGFALPFNRAEKAVSHIDPSTGQRIEPSAPNAVKFETFVFDALPLCQHSIVYETERIEEFAPIKNADAPDPSKCVDSPRTSMQVQTARAGRWLEAQGVKLPRDASGQIDAVIDISHLTAIEAADLARIDLPSAIAPGTQLKL